MKIEMKKVQTADYELSYQESYSKNKTEKSSNANKEFLAEFHIGLTLAMYFRMLHEQEP